MSLQPSYSTFSGTRSNLDTKPTTDDEDQAIRTRILLVGLRRSGKTSIQQVLFNNLVPKQSFFLETTMKVTVHKVDSIIPLEIWDCPGNTTIDTIGAPLSSFASIIFVVDIQDTYQGAIDNLLAFSTAAYIENPDVNLDIFLHKAEALSEDFRFENFRHFEGRVLDDLADKITTTLPGSKIVPVATADIPLNFYLTSIHDHSVHEAFSRVLQHLILHTSLPALEDLLNIFCSNSHCFKVFLFDIHSRVFVATDNSPVDSVRHSLCCDYLFMLSSFRSLYKSAISSPTEHPRRTGVSSRPASSSTSPASLTPTATHHAPNSAVTISPALLMTDTTSTSQQPSLLPDIAISTSPAIMTQQSTKSPEEPAGSFTRPIFYPSAATSLAPDTTVIYHLMTPQLALVAMLPTWIWEGKRGLVEYNVAMFREGVQEICAVEQQDRRKPVPSVPPSTPPTASNPKKKR